MAELKTRRTTASVAAFLKRIPDAERRADCQTLVRLMKAATRAEPKMWGTSIVGFGTYHYVYASGREGDWPRVGFSPRKNDLTLYLMGGFTKHAALMAKLGRHKHGKSCLYLKRLADVDMAVLKELIAGSVKHMKMLYP